MPRDMPYVMLHAQPSAPNSDSHFYLVKSCYVVAIAPGAVDCRVAIPSTWQDLRSRHEKPDVLALELPSPAMAIDTRDHYRDKIRKKTGYVERADFRMSEHDIVRQRHAKAWRSNWIKIGVLLALIAAAVWLKR